MSVATYQRLVLQYQKEISNLQQDKARHSIKAADYRKKAHAAIALAGRASSPSTAQMRLKEASRHEEQGVKHDKELAKIEAKLAQTQKRLNTENLRLSKATTQEANRKATQQHNTNLQTLNTIKEIQNTLTEHRQLHQIALSTLEKLQEPSEQITVLFFASNPIDQQQLRLDEEVRSIRDNIQKSLHREAVKLESRWAVRPLDVLQAINECNPRIVHFSGHGSDSEEIIFQDSSGNAKLVSKEAIVQTIVAGSDDIQLVFFNTCYSHAQAEAVVDYIPAAIGMTTSIGDDAARVFASQFYSSLGFGRSLARAFDQAKAALMLEGIPEEDTPELFIAEGLNADEIVLVKGNNT